MGRTITLAYKLDGTHVPPKRADVVLKVYENTCTLGMRNGRVFPCVPYSHDRRYVAYTPDGLHRTIEDDMNFHHFTPGQKLLVVTSLPLPKGSAERFAERMEQYERAMPTGASAEVRNTRMGW